MAGFPDGSGVKNMPGNVGDSGSITGSGRSPAEGNGSPLQYSCLENSMDRQARRATVHGVTKSQTQLKQLSVYACTHAHTHTDTRLSVEEGVCVSFAY